MRAVTKRSKQSPDPAPWKLLLWATVAGLIFGLIGFGEIAEDWLRMGRNSLHQHKASGDIVIVKIDVLSLRKYGNWPWPRRYHADLVDRLTQAGAHRTLSTSISPTHPITPTISRSAAPLRSRAE